MLAAKRPMGRIRETRVSCNCHEFIRIRFLALSRRRLESVPGDPRYVMFKSMVDTDPLVLRSRDLLVRAQLIRSLAKEAEITAVEARASVGRASQCRCTADDRTE